MIKHSNNSAYKGLKRFLKVSWFYDADAISVIPNSPNLICLCYQSCYQNLVFSTNLTA